MGANKARNVLSAGVIIVRLLEGGSPRYLLLRAYRYWDFPKGEVAPGEEPQTAAIREVREETSLAGLEFRWGDVFKETAPYRGGKRARYYVAESRNGAVVLAVNPELGRPEHHEYRWLEYPAARELLAERVQPILAWAHQLVLAG